MARLFTASSGEYMTLSTALSGQGMPMSVGAWIKPVDNNASRTIYGATDQGFQFRIRADDILAITRRAIGDYAIGNVTITHDVWQFLGFYWDGSNGGNSVRFYVGTNENWDSGAGISLHAVTAGQKYIGRMDFFGSTDEPMNGSMAEFAAWNVTLTTAEFRALAMGYSPLFIRPASLISYCPLIRDVVDKKTGVLTATGTSVVDHPIVIYPRERRFSGLEFIPSAVGLMAPIVDYRRIDRVVNY